MPQSSTCNMSETRLTLLSKQAEPTKFNPSERKLTLLFVFSIQQLNSLIERDSSTDQPPAVDFDGNPFQTNAFFLFHFQRYHMFFSPLNLKPPFPTSPSHSLLSETNSVLVVKKRINNIFSTCRRSVAQVTMCQYISQPNSVPLLSLAVITYMR